MTRRPNNATVVEACARRIRSLDSYVDGGAQIAINGRKYAHADVRAIYQRCLDAREAAARLRAQLLEAIATIAETETQRLEADAALRAWVRAEFGVTSAEAIDFGFPAPRKPTHTIEGKALAVARRKATREARHTMGARQKERIRGVIAEPATATAVAAATTTEPSAGEKKS